MYIEEIKRGLRGEIKKRENEQYFTFQTNVREMCKDVLDKLEEQESVIADNDKEIRRQKYKRCLANAEACMHKRWRNNEVFDFARSTRHMNTWLSIAEKFKEAK